MEGALIFLSDSLAQITLRQCAKDPHHIADHIITDLHKIIDTCTEFGIEAGFTFQLYASTQITLARRIDNGLDIFLDDG